MAYDGYPEYPQACGGSSSRSVSIFDCSQRESPRSAILYEDCHVKLSIVTTLYRSAATINEFYRRAMSAAEAQADDIELIMVNDGSPDASLELALALHRNDARVVIVDLARNFGHHKAMMTGLSYASGDLVFLIDSDLEEPPELRRQDASTIQSRGLRCRLRRAANAARRLARTGQWRPFLFTRKHAERSTIATKSGDRSADDAGLRACLGAAPRSRVSDLATVPTVRLPPGRARDRETIVFANELLGEPADRHGGPVHHHHVDQAALHHPVRRFGDLRSVGRGHSVLPRPVRHDRHWCRWLYLAYRLDMVPGRTDDTDPRRVRHLYREHSVGDETAPLHGGGAMCIERTMAQQRGPQT